MSPTGEASPATSLSWFKLLIRIWRASGKFEASSSVVMKMRRISLLFRSIGHLGALRRWHSRPASLDSMLQRHALAPMLRSHPYMTLAWDHERRMHAIEAHYRLLAGPLASLDVPLGGQLCLADMDDVCPGLRLALDRPNWFRHEGELALSLFLKDDRLYSLVFSIGMEGIARVAFVGALQGRGGSDTIDIYREIGHVLHGMRPRDFIVAAFRLLCAELEVERVLAVSDACSVRRSEYFDDTSCIHFNYDAAWQEYQGTLGEDGFFDLPIALHLRSHEEIPARKRALYRKRYAMLDTVRDRLAAARQSATQVLTDTDRSSAVTASARWVEGLPTCSSTAVALGECLDFMLRMA